MIHTHTLKQLWLYNLILFTLFSGVALSQSKEQLSFLFVGDVMQHGPQIKGAYNAKTDSYDYSKTFQFIAPVIRQADIAIGNLEVTHAGKPYAGYPQFSAPDELSYTLKEVGFDVLITANNHSCDGGAKGVIRTLDVLDQVGIRHTGTFRNQAERDANYPLIINQGGMKVALLNYTYGTNGLFVPKPLIINYIDSAVIAKDVAKAKQMADYIICTMHWGTEYEPLPGKYQKNYEKYCYELGVDMVIGSHPHVIQPIERKEIDGKERLTAWSEGNFVSNQRSRYKNGGLLVHATLAHDNVDGKGNNIILKDAAYSLAYVYAKEEVNSRPYYILPDYPYNVVSPGFIIQEEKEKMDQFFEDTRSHLKENNIGVEEAKLDLPEDQFGAYLKGYFANLLEVRSDAKWPKYSDFQRNFIHRLIGEDGNYYYISGMMQERADTEVNKQFLESIGLFTEGNVRIEGTAINRIR